MEKSFDPHYTRFGDLKVGDRFCWHGCEYEKISGCLADNLLIERDNAGFGNIEKDIQEFNDDDTVYFYKPY